MTELHYAFIKNSIVEQIAVFVNEDQELADFIINEQGYDSAVWVGSNPPIRFSSYDGENFTEPTLDYLYERGISQENTAMREARLQAEEEALND